MGQTLQVLVADDDPSILLLLRALEELEDVVVTTAVDGIDALAKARAGAYDVFVFDVMMPAMNGLELVRSVREDEAIKATPIIMVTARDDDDTRSNAKGAGADLLLVKPVSMNELGRAITDLGKGKKRRRLRRS